MALPLSIVKVADTSSVKDVTTLCGFGARCSSISKMRICISDGCFNLSAVGKINSGGSTHAVRRGGRQLFLLLP